MEERDIVEVRAVEDCTEWSSNEQCMSANPDTTSACNDTMDKVFTLEYEDEPDKTFYTGLCDSCAREYNRKWDLAQIYGDEVLEEDNEYQIN